MQVRLAAPGEHRGGFGTCGRRARGRTSPHQDPRPTPQAGNPRPRWRQALHGLCDPHVAGSCTRTSADPRPALPGPGRASAARTLLRTSDSDWPGSGQHHQPGRTALGPTCWSRSSAYPGPATARPRRALALHGPSRGPVTQIESDWPGANYATGLHHTSPGGLDQPGQTRYPGKAVSDSIHHLRSSADPRPATARPGGARAARTLPRAGAPD